MRSRSSLGWLALVLGVVVVGLLVVAPSPRSDEPLHPSAAGPAGAEGLVLVLEELGAEVVVGVAPPASASTAVLLRDELSDEERDELRAWVADGGVLLVADPGSPLAEVQVGASCPEAIAGVDVLQFSPGTSGVVTRGADCFEGVVRSRTVGSGAIVVVGGAAPFVNDLLDEADNAVLAAAVLVPTGQEQVLFVHGGAGGGDERLFDLLGPRVAQALGQASIAVLLYVLWRGRRLGRPVAEHQPVEVAGSALVAAVGRILGARRRPADAAATIRRDLIGALERRTGLPAGGYVDPLAAAVAARTGLDPGWVLDVLVARPVDSDADLVALTADLDRIRSLVLEPQGARS